MRKSNFALRQQPSLLNEARKLAEVEGVALNQLINVAVAEKLSALRTESYFKEQAVQADIPKALEILKRAGVGPGCSADSIHAITRGATEPPRAIRHAGNSSSRPPTHHPAAHRSHEPGPVLANLSLLRILGMRHRRAALLAAGS